MSLIRVDANVLARSMPTVLVMFSVLYVLVEWSQSAWILLALMIVCTIVAGLLKRVIRQSRPKQTETQRRKDACSDNGLGVVAGIQTYGMPSGHTLLTTAFVVFALGISITRAPKFKRRQWLYYLAAGLFLFSLVVIVARQRLSTSCHNKAQIFVGAIVGVFLGALALHVHFAFS